jgi:hypothetical protein
MFSNEHDRDEDLMVLCECVPCADCSGEGLDASRCDKCHGTGTDSGDCACHADINGESYPTGVCCPGWARHQRHSRTCENYLSNVADENDTDPEVAA